jgi:hypothetical protein
MPVSRIYSAYSSASVLRRFLSRRERSVVPQFTRDGAHLFVTYNAGIAYRWDIRPSTWARHACAVAGGQLRRAEWANALPERDYAPAC